MLSEMIPILLIILAILYIMNRRLTAYIVGTNQVRGIDAFGSGQYGASRRKANGETYNHQGLDIICEKGQEVKAPFDCKFVRNGYVYTNDVKYRLLVLQGVNAYSDYEVKIMYATSLDNLINVKRGEVVAIAQDISEKYKGITPHIHIEVRKNRILINPKEIL